MAISNNRKAVILSTDEIRYEGSRLKIVKDSESENGELRMTEVDDVKIKLLQSLAVIS